MCAHPITCRNARRIVTGSVAVELALLLIPFAVALAGVFELGRAFWYYNALAKSTRDAARYVSSANSASIASVAKPTAVAMVVSASQAAGMSPPLADTDVSVNCLNALYQPLPACTDGVEPSFVEVHVNYSFTIGGILPAFLASSDSGPIVANFAPATTMMYIFVPK